MRRGGSWVTSAADVGVVRLDGGIELRLGDFLVLRPAAVRALARDRLRVEVVRRVPLRAREATHRDAGHARGTPSALGRAELRGREEGRQVTLRGRPILDRLDGSHGRRRLDGRGLGEMW